MKTIMDCRRIPKPAYFAYMDCLSPVFCSLRSDRFSFFSGEKMKLEAWIASDEGPMDTLNLMVQMGGKTIYSAELPASPELFQGFVEFVIPDTKKRTSITVFLGTKKNDVQRHWTKETYSVWPKEEIHPLKQISYEEYDADRVGIEERASAGDRIVLGPMTPGNYDVAGREITVTACGMSALYCVSRDTGHPFTKGLEPNDLSYLYDSALDRLSPIIEATFEGEGVIPVILSGNQDENGNWHRVLAMGEIPCGKGSIVLNQLLLENKYKNPAVVRLANNIL